MSLIDRLTGAEEPKIPTHQFWSGMIEISLGEMTIAEFKTYFNVSGDDASDFDWLISQYQASANKERFLQLMHVIFLLSEMNTPGYIAQADVVARINRIG